MFNTREVVFITPFRVSVLDLRDFKPREQYISKQQNRDDSRQFLRLCMCNEERSKYRQA